MLPLADGSDMGGSLRNPASFCNVVGLRPSVGRVPQWPATNAWETTDVSGPLGRTVEDVALLLSVVAGPDPRVPTASETPGASFAPPLTRSLAGLRVALSLDLGGAFAVDPEVAAVVEAAGGVFSAQGATVRSAHPVLDEAEDTFRTLRAWLFWQEHGELLRAHPDGLKESLAANVRAGQGLTGDDVWRAYRQRTALEARMTGFFDDHDVLVLPTSQVAPFPADQEYPATVAGEETATYLDWMRSAYLITVTGCPAVSVPAGFTPAGLPVGVQLVSRPRAERRLLEVAWAFEQATRYGEHRPPL
jgi:amidase